MGRARYTCSGATRCPLRAKVGKSGVHVDSPSRGHCSQRMIGTVERLLNGNPSTTLVL